MNEMVKIAVIAPESHADIVRKALGDAGAGRMGDYSHSSFSIKGVGRFIPLEGAEPAIGEVGKLQEVAEERIETICKKRDVAKVIAAVKEVHPYEEVAIDVFPLLADPQNIAFNDEA